MVLLSVGAALQRWVPMTKWGPALGRSGPVPPQWQGTAVAHLPARSANAQERAAAVAVRAASRRLPWHSSCLAEAFAGQVLLRQSGRPGVVVIGLRHKDEGPWDAHAWLLGQGGALTGGPAARGFTPVTVFQVAKGLSADEISLAMTPSKATEPDTETATWKAPQGLGLTKLVSPPQID